MADIQINTGGANKGDLVFSQGDLVFVRGRDAILVHVFVRMSFFLGEYALDQRIGIPYYQQILIKSANMPAVEAIFRETILTTPGVLELQRLDLDFDGSTRALSVAFSALTTDGVLTFEEEFIINV